MINMRMGYDDGREFFGAKRKGIGRAQIAKTRALEKTAIDKDFRFSGIKKETRAGYFLRSAIKRNTHYLQLYVLFAIFKEEEDGDAAEKIEKEIGKSVLQTRLQ